MTTNPTSAELSARLTAARAVLGDFRRALDTAPLTSPPRMAEWALRLASSLGDVLDAAVRPAPAAAPPLETEGQARELPAVRAVYAAFDADPSVGRMAPHNERMLVSACYAAGVELGAYDRRIVAWLAGWEPQTCAVVAGLITRAAARREAVLAPAVLAGNVDLTPYQHAVLGQALADAIQYRDPGACADCEAEYGGLCYDHAADEEKADAYLVLARQLGIEVER